MRQHKTRTRFKYEKNALGEVSTGTQTTDVKVDEQRCKGKMEQSLGRENKTKQCSRHAAIVHIHPFVL